VFALSVRENVENIDVRWGNALLGVYRVGMFVLVWELWVRFCICSGNVILPLWDVGVGFYHVIAILYM